MPETSLPPERVPAPREVYLDYAAATPMCPEALEAMLPFLSERFENPSAPYARARAARTALEEARATLVDGWGNRGEQPRLCRR